MDSTTFSRAIELSASTFTTRRSRLLAAILPILGNADLLGGGLFTVKVFLANVAASAACAILAWVCIASKVVARKVFSALVRSREVSPRVWAWGVFSAMLSYTGKRVLYAVKNAETVAWLKYNLQQAESALYHLCFLCFHTCVSLVCVHLMLRRYQNSMYDESKRPMSNESSDADEIVISDDDDDEDEDDDFGDFATPATTMKTVTTPVMRDEPPPTTTTTTTGGGEFDLIALTNEGEFAEAARRLLKRGKARSTNDGAEKESFGGLGTAAVVGDGRFTKEAFDRFRDNVKREASAEASASEEDEEETSVDDAAPREILAEFDLISLESAPKVAESTPSMDPFAGFGDIAVEFPSPPQNADNDDEFGDFV